MSQQKRKDVVMIRDVVCSFPHLFHPKVPQTGGKAKYSANFLIDPTTEVGKQNIKDLHAVMSMVARDTWGTKAKLVIQNMQRTRKFFRDGSSELNSNMEVYHGYEGMKLVALTNHQQPQLLNLDKTPALDLGTFYGGCRVDVVLAVYAVNSAKQGGNGLFATVEAVRFRSHGNQLGGTGGGDFSGMFEDLDGRLSSQFSDDPFVDEML